MRQRERECVCVWERESVCEREREYLWPATPHSGCASCSRQMHSPERVCVSVCECICVRESVCVVCARERVWADALACSRVCVSVCVCERERERERGCLCGVCGVCVRERVRADATACPPFDP